jgi:APA family basic amino acid/polyamine antiporter
MVAGTIIGASIFVQPSEIARHLETPGQIMAVWLACGVLTLFGALVCAELASAFPQTGGLYVFLRDTFSPLAGFLWGWAMFWTMHSGIVAAIATVFARYAGHFVDAGPTGTRAMAVGVIAALSALNYVGVRAGSRVQTALTGAKLVAIAAIVVVGFVLADSAAQPAAAAAPAGGGTLSAFLLAMVAGLFAYGGWHMVTYTAGETVMPARTIPAALMVGVAIVTACYIALNLVYLAVLPVAAVRTSTRVAADVADAVLGRGGAALMAGLVMVSSLGALTGIVLTGPRVYYSMAQDGTLFKWLGAVHPTFGTPHRAIVIQGIWASVLAFTNTYGALFSRVIYTEWIFFAAMAAGLMLLRKRPAYRPTYRIWGYPLVPIVFTLASAVIVVMQIQAVPRDSLIGLGMVLLGLPVYFVWSRRTAARPA